MPCVEQPGRAADSPRRQTFRGSRTQWKRYMSFNAIDFLEKQSTVYFRVLFELGDRKEALMTFSP
jgi:hypothetical protein